MNVVGGMRGGRMNGSGEYCFDSMILVKGSSAVIAAAGGGFLEDRTGEEIPDRGVNWKKDATESDD